MTDHPTPGVEDFEALLAEAVKAQLVADRAFGAYLGALDAAGERKRYAGRFLREWQHARAQTPPPERAAETEER